MSSHSDDSKLPTWLADYLGATGEMSSVSAARRVPGGVVADTWRVTLGRAGDWAMKLTPSAACQTEVVGMLSRINCPWLPEEFEVVSTGEGAVSRYRWVVGAELTSATASLFTNDIHRLHEFAFPARQPSIYVGVREEAEELVAQPSVGSTVRDLSRAILAGLEPDALGALLDPLGHITHGDLKPANLIGANTGVKVIDWEKVGMLSPEADLVMHLFTSGLGRPSSTVLRGRHYRTDVMEAAVQWVPVMYVVHDVWRGLRDAGRALYAKRGAMRLWKDWADHSA